MLAILLLACATPEDDTATATPGAGIACVTIEHDCSTAPTELLPDEPPLSVAFFGTGTNGDGDPAYVAAEPPVLVPGTEALVQACPQSSAITVTGYRLVYCYAS
jgi:hypothetical protein